MSLTVAAFIIFIMLWLSGLVAWLIYGWPRELRRQNTELREMVKELRSRLEWFLQKLVAAEQELDQLRAGALPSKSSARGRIVAVFPDLAVHDPLSFDAEKRILREAGGDWQLVTVEGQQATRSGIAHELYLGGGARLLYLASHGGDGHIALSGGETANRDWLPSLVRFYGIKAVVLNTCDSDDFAVSLLSAGAEMVLTAAEKIDDKQAGRMAVAFLQALARGETAERAAEYARLNCDDATAAMLRLRGDKAWSWA